MHVCMYVCMYACMHACMYMYVCMHVCIYAHVHNAHAHAQITHSDLHLLFGDLVIEDNLKRLDALSNQPFMN